MAFPAFRSFCLEHRDEIGSLIETRLTQTNVIQRCTYPAAGVRERLRAGRAPPAGADRDRPERRAEHAVEPLSLRVSQPRRPAACVPNGATPGHGLTVEAELRGDVPLPKLEADPLRVAWRRGIDIHPVDHRRRRRGADWLRALVWPEHVGRQERLSRAIEMARRRTRPRSLLATRPIELPELLERAPRDATLCVYGTHTLYQFPREARRRVFHALQAAAVERPLYVHRLRVDGRPLLRAAPDRVRGKRRARPSCWPAAVRTGAGSSGRGSGRAQARRTDPLRRISRPAGDPSDSLAASADPRVGSASLRAILRIRLLRRPTRESGQPPCGRSFGFACCVGRPESRVSLLACGRARAGAFPGRRRVPASP